MSLIQIQREHALGPARAKAVVDHMAQRMHQQYQVDTCWESDALMRFQRTGIKGHIEIGATVIRVEVRLGLLLAPLKRTVQDEIARHLQQYLEQAETTPDNL